MRLATLVDGSDVRPLAGTLDVEVTGIAIDSRRVAPGDVFFALAGTRTDGRRHVAEAVSRGARAIVGTGPIDAGGTTVLETRSPRAVLAHAAARLAGDPSAAMTLVGVTGTNGKTTTTYLLDAIWRAAGRTTGVIGTIAYRVADESRPAPLTTPEAPEIQRLLADMLRAGVTHAVMEASSIALAQERATALRFDAAVFTNLTLDHLDFHGDMAAYYAAKARLFLELLPAGGKPDPVAIVNVDDASGAHLAATVGTRCVTFGRGPDAVVHPLDVESTLAGTRGVLALGPQRMLFTSALVGAPHTENIAAAAAAAWALGVDAEAIAAGIAAAPLPAGRVERIAGPGFTVVVDYAHTPDALERLLDALRPLTPGALITVFGCGGDRDRGKRPVMGDAAARRSDIVVLTSDNPRTEEPAAILAEIESGIRGGGMVPVVAPAPGVRGYCVEPDRPRAIELAIGLARPGDLVVVAGKGHEDYQIIGTVKHHLDDREEVRRALARLGA
ncbi:MAG: UDP-N-acetylmuramoyl-L-alanyl-D-glutamate--2,6-diaminopimelate ligase [Candidatus Binatia bacterium]